MSDDTGIEWTHVPGYRGATWNPVRGCTKISPGCKHCYAETFAERFRGVAGHPYGQGFDLRLVPEKLDEPLRATKPRAYFVNSMSDLFQADVPFEFVAATFGVMAATSRHLHMVLTKRADRMAEFMRAVPVDDGTSFTGEPLRSISEDDDRYENVLHPLRAAGDAIFAAATAAKRSPHDATEAFNNTILDSYFPWPLPNVWLGVSVEDRKYGLPRIDILRETPAAVRFLSVEPLLEDLGELDLTGIHWVVVGGESGNGARVCDLRWIRSVVAQCRAAKVPVFVKQLGAHPRGGDGVLVQLTSKKGGALADLPPDLRIREFPIGGAA